MKNFILLSLLSITSFACKPAHPDIQLAVGDIPIPAELKDQATIDIIHFINALHASFEAAPDMPTDPSTLAKLEAAIKKLNTIQNISPIYLIRARRLFSFDLQNRALLQESIVHLTTTLSYFDRFEAKELWDHYEYAYCHNLMGIAYDLTLNNAKAIYHHRESLKRNLEIGFYLEAVKDYVHLSEHPRSIGDFATALIMLDSAILLNERYAKYLNTRQDSVNTLGIFYIAAKTKGLLGQKALMAYDTTQARKNIKNSISIFKGITEKIRAIGPFEGSKNYLIMTHFEITNFSGLLASETEMAQDGIKAADSLLQLTLGNEPWHSLAMSRKILFLSQTQQCEKISKNDLMHLNRFYNQIKSTDVYPVPTEVLCLSTLIDLSKTKSYCFENQENEQFNVLNISITINKRFNKLIQNNGVGEPPEFLPIPAYNYARQSVSHHLDFFNKTGNLKYLETAFEINEADKDMALRQTLSQREALSVWTGKKKALLEEEQSYNNQLNELRANDAPDKEIARVKQEQQAFMYRLQTSSDPETRSFYLERLSSIDLKVANVRTLLKDDRTALLTLSPTQSAFISFVLTRDSLKHFSAPMNKTIFDALVDLQEQLGKERDEQKHSAFFVYNSIFKPIFTWMKMQGISKVYVIHDQLTKGLVLDYLPYSLKNGSWNRQHLLIDDFEFSYHSSVGVLLAGKKLSSHKFRPAGARVGGLVNIHPEERDLTSLKRMTLSWFDQSTKPNAVLRENVALQPILQSMRELDVVQLLAHGYISPDNPALYALRIYNHTTQKDEFLKPVHVYNEQLPTRLAVLANCDGGTERISDQFNGRVTLARAFIYAGVNTVIAGQAYLKDQSTASILDLFYKYWIEEGLTVAGALTEAKREFRQKQTNAHPNDWANLIVTGDPELCY